MQMDSAPLEKMARKTTIVDARRLSTRLGIDLTIATETFQHTGSFKFRAAYNLASKVAERKIVTASSGNFGQAMAYASYLVVPLIARERTLGALSLVSAGSGRRYTAEDSPPDQFRVAAIHERTDGELWVGAVNGLYRLPAGSSAARFERVSIGKERPDGVRGFAEDSAGTSTR